MRLIQGRVYATSPEAALDIIHDQQAAKGREIDGPVWLMLAPVQPRKTEQWYEWRAKVIGGSEDE